MELYDMKAINPTISVLPAETLGQTSARDKDYLNSIEKIVSDSNHPLRHVLALWPSYVQRINITRFLAHYELFKHVIDMPGCIVECGVGRGSSFFTFTKFMEIFCPNDRQRRVYGFEHFKGLRNFHFKDGEQKVENNYVEGGWSPEAAKDEIMELCRLANLDSIIPGSVRCEIIDGPLEQTIPQFLKDKPGLRISLLHIDVDIYQPTYNALKHLYPLVLNGGVVAFDEYAMIPWQGETCGAEDYFNEMNIHPEFKKFPFSLNPHGYFIKRSNPKQFD